MLQVLRKTTPFTVLILFIFSFIAKLPALQHPVYPRVSEGRVLFSLILSALDLIFQKNAFIYTLLGVTMIFAQSMYLNAIVIRHRMYVRPTLLPAYCYLLLTSLHPAFNYFSESLVACWFLLATLDMLLHFHQAPYPRKEIFNAAFMTAMVGLIQFQAVTLVIMLFAALLLLRSFNIGEWIVAVLGYLTPIYFFSAGLFLFDKLGDFLDFPGIHLRLFTSGVQPLYLSFLLLFLLPLTGLGMYGLKVNMPKSTIFIRRCWWLVILALVLCVIVAVLSSGKWKTEWLICMPALSLIAAQVFYLDKNKQFSNFIFYFSILFIVICLWALK